VRLAKDFQELAEIAASQGWRIEQRKNAHLSWISPQGLKVFSSFTPSDKRAVKNLRRDLKRYGLKV
jgi:hypothetical protein